MKGSVPMVELLLRNGASASLTTREGDTAVELALRYGHADAAELLKRARQEAEAVAAAETVPQAGT
jgi:ankyrin repeat protein